MVGGVVRSFIRLPYPEEVQYALPNRHIACLGGYDYHGDGGGGVVVAVAAAGGADGSCPYLLLLMHLSAAALCSNYPR